MKGDFEKRIFQKYVRAGVRYLFVFSISYSVGILVVVVVVGVVVF